MPGNASDATVAFVVGVDVGDVVAGASAEVGGVALLLLEPLHAASKRINAQMTGGTRIECAC
jgi:hypothetical protein